MLAMKLTTNSVTGKKALTSSITLHHSPCDTDDEGGCAALIMSSFVSKVVPESMLSNVKCDEPSRGPFCTCRLALHQVIRIQGQDQAADDAPDYGSSNKPQRQVYVQQKAEANTRTPLTCK